MSNEPIFEKMAREYAARGKSYENMIAPYLSPVRSLGTEQLSHTPVYGPNPHLDGPFREPLPKRTLAHLIEPLKPDPEFVKHFQELISRAPQMALQGTLMGSVLTSFEGASMDPEIVDEVIRFQETGKLDDVRPDLAAKQLELYRGIVPTSEIVDAGQLLVSYEDVIDAANKYEGVFLRKVVTIDELIDGRTSADIIQELGQEFAEKYPNAVVAEVNVGEEFNGDMVVTVRGTLISEEDIEEKHRNALHAMAQYATLEQTDKSVNAASNEEIDDEDEPVFVAPNFWKIRDEE